MFDGVRQKFKQFELDFLGGSRYVRSCMQKRFVKAEPKDIIGSSFVGYLIAPYKEFVNLLGEPNDRTKDGKWKSNDRKVRVEWSFKTFHKQPAVITIYDYKEIQPVQNVILWHLGLKGDKKYLDLFLKDKKLVFPRR